MRKCTTQGENKGRKQQRTRAPLRQPSATAPTRRDTPKGSKTKSPVCVVLKTYHLTGIHHKSCLKHSNFLNRKLCVQLLPTWNTMAAARGQGTEVKQSTPKRVETRFKTRQLQHFNSLDVSQAEPPSLVEGPSVLRPSATKINASNVWCLMLISITSVRSASGLVLSGRTRA